MTCSFTKHRNELIRYGKNFANAVGASTGLTSVDAVQILLRSEYEANTWTDKSSEFGTLAAAVSTSASTPLVAEFTLNPATDASNQVASSEYRARVDVTASNNQKYTAWIDFHITDTATT